IPGGLSVLRPDLEVRVADKLHFLVGVVLHPPVWAGARGRDLDFLVRRSRRKDERERDRNLVEKLRVATRQVERDGVVRVVNDDALVQVARRRGLDAGVAADDHVVPGAGIRALADLEQSLEGVLDVARLELLAVRELDSLADRELVGLTAVGRRRDR